MQHFYPITGLAAFRNAVIRLTIIFTCFFLSLKANAQSSPEYTRSYLNNLVDISLGDFGLITGEDSSNLYFIAVRRSIAKEDAPAEGISNNLKSVKFFSNTYTAKASKVSESVFGPYTVVLYRSPKPAGGFWQRNYFYSVEHKKGKLSTFRDKWLSDRIWAVMEAKMEIIRQPKNGIARLEVPLEAGIAKGMPLVNNEGFIAAVFAESTLGKTVVSVIDMKEIADALYVSAGDNCRYFQMIEWGQTDVRCVIEQKEKEAAEAKARQEEEEKANKALAKQLRKQGAEKDSSENISVTGTGEEKKEHFLDYGIHGNILFDPLLRNNPNRDNDFNTRTFHLGLTLHLNIDKKGANRITLKPRYGNFAERNDDGLWTSPGEDVRIIRTTYRYAEMPVMLERRLLRAKNYSIAIGAGYSPGYVFSHQYDWVDKAVTSISREAVKGGGSSLTHRFIGELHFYEFQFGRLTAVYAQDLSAYPHANFVLPVNGTDYTPFANKQKPWYIGLEMAIRLRGTWIK